jgi:hypothetical protein
MTSTTSIVGDFADRAYGYENSGQKYANVTLSADGAIVAAVTGQKIRVLSMVLFCDEADELVTVQITSNNAAGTTLSPVLLTGSLQNTFGGMSGAERGSIQQPLILPFNPAGWMETAEGEALFANVTIVGTFNNQIGIMVTYDETSP